MLLQIQNANYKTLFGTLAATIQEPPGAGTLRTVVILATGAESLKSFFFEELVMKGRDFLLH